MLCAFKLNLAHHNGCDGALINNVGTEQQFYLNCTYVYNTDMTLFTRTHVTCLLARDYLHKNGVCSTQVLLLCIKDFMLRLCACQQLMSFPRNVSCKCQ